MEGISTSHGTTATETNLQSTFERKKQKSEAQSFDLCNFCGLEYKNLQKLHKNHIFVYKNHSRTALDFHWKLFNDIFEQIYHVCSTFNRQFCSDSRFELRMPVQK